MIKFILFWWEHWNINIKGTYQKYNTHTQNILEIGKVYNVENWFSYVESLWKDKFPFNDIKITADLFIGLFLKSSKHGF